MSDELDTWGGITEYVVDDGGVIRCYAYRLFGDEWTRIKLRADERHTFDSVDDVPEGWTLVGTAENHPEPYDELENDDRRVIAVFAPFHGHDWGVVELDRAEGDE